ncbi:sensor histidine kinase [Agromyces mediolanus]|uniref:sensor histidine kinase n=1 Tax=Agromyces mediolanus TaxID=41986 RepID=UPI001E524CD6|nr:ATP-binding protein [Agromyces mediolanus]MCD1571806.1 histidine kinase [Agromyces mediolanus]
MHRIHNERDRLLARIARLTGLSGCTGAVLCLLVPDSTGLVARIAAIVLSLLVAGAIVLHTERGELGPALGAAAAGVAAILLVGLDTPGAAGSTAIAAIAGAATASLALTLVPRRHGQLIVASLAVLVVVAVWIGAVAGRGSLLPIVAAVAGWAACGLLATWTARAIDRAADRISEVGRAHEAERLASEAESQQRQDARLLHDTVLATLSLLAHSGVGVGQAALRDQARDDARLLRQLRLGVPLEVGSHPMYAPEADEDALGSTFESVRQRFARMGLDVNWHGAGQLLLPRDSLDALLGALGECLENVRRHSGVNEADVTVTDDERAVRAMITDAGSGFQTDAVEPGRLGFAESVVGRLHAVGGRARVFSSPGAGTTVMLEVPKP